MTRPSSLIYAILILAPAFTSVQPDLLGGSTATDKLTVVLHNESGRKFRDVAAEIGLSIPQRSARQTNWIDYDNDGDLDVYAANRSGENKLFRNTAGKFTHVF